MNDKKLLHIDTAKELIDFSGGKEELKELGELQMRGAVALYNKIQEHGIGYLADEVGMGKTYIALGVVALMRYVNPSLKVLYIVPKQNLLQKWHDTDYPNFLRDNFKVANYKVKKEDSAPAAKSVMCQNLRELIEYASTGYYGDYFMKMSSFSFGLTDDNESLKKRLFDLHKMVPAYRVPEISEFNKEQVKKEYAQTINKILPDFDLIVIDEAHNFRKGPEVSDRNKVLSRILGTYPGEAAIRRVKHTLLLSATPFEFGLNELKQQLTIVGYDHLLPTTSMEKDARNKLLNTFMVRRLNTINVGGKMHTRNMYRTENREEAAITLTDDDYKTKLITALVQKKVGELIRDMKGQYQTGMLASFESYLPSTTNIDVEFDGEQDDRGEAKDTSIIQALTRSYQKKFGESTLPHPKMDKTVEKYGNQAFYNGEKQLIFVRRVQSVSDLKSKFDDKYDLWLKKHLVANISNKSIKKNLLEIFDDFSKKKMILRDKSSAFVEQEENNTDEADLEASPSNNNFFTYFFRGKFDDATEGYVKPLTFRRYLTGKKEDFHKVFDFNGEFFERIFDLFSSEECITDQELFLFYQELLFSVLRLGHGFIDMYIAYINGGKEHFTDAFIKLLNQQKENKEVFSTYQQLRDITENIELIVKTNFSQYRQKHDNWRRYIQYQISPLEPVIGATGGDDKSFVARRFRMPGYPMILISTDVLQEGEDLHTFCSSVVHYGLSASPIAIEQKTGRVDRVGSLAQRRLMAAEGVDALANLEQLGINVDFPFLKESIEGTQVREVARRLNKFLISLHDFDTKIETISELGSKLLMDRSPIPPLVKDFLTSPFVVDEYTIKPDKNILELHIEEDQKRIEIIKKHITDLIKDKSKGEISAGPTPNSLIWKCTQEKSEPFDNIHTFMRNEAIPHYRRAFLDTWNSSKDFSIRYSVDLFIGDFKITQQEEIAEAYERLKNGKSVESSCHDVRIVDLFNPKSLYEFTRNHKVEVFLDNNKLTFKFESNISNLFYRAQYVDVKICEGYLILTSKAVQWKEQGLTDNQLIEFTLERNKEIDIVEFLLDDKWIFGRVVHPTENLQAEEFMYYAYILACETDHLEHIINDFRMGDRY